MSTKRTTHAEPGEIGAPEAAARLNVSEKFLHMELDKILHPRIQIMAKGTRRCWYRPDRVMALASTRAALQVVGDQVRAVRALVGDELSSLWKPTEAEPAKEPGQ